MQQLKLTFIGAGNMARSMIRGLINNRYSPALITAASPTEAKHQDLSANLGIHVTVDNITACSHADAVILCVKPHQVKRVCQQLKPIITQRHLPVLSVAAGITLSSLMQWLGPKIPIIRCMPNLPAMLACGATALIANHAAAMQHKEIAEGLLRSIGVTVWVTKETEMDLITAISGCGPAYFFVVMSALEQAAVKHGLSAEVAHLLVTQTAAGASQIALTEPHDLTDLIAKVTSSGGATEKALQVLEEAHIMNLFEKAVLAAEQQSVALSQELEHQ